MITKHCSACSRDKGIDDFYKTKQHNDGRCYTCKECCENRRSEKTNKIKEANVQRLLNDGWIRINGFEKYYLINNNGDIYSIRSSKNMSPGRNKKGYRQTILRGDNGTQSQAIRIHRQVAIHFISNPNNYEQVNHIDGNKENNSVDNLEWCTNRENALHALNMGLRDNIKKGCDVYNSRFNVQDVLRIRELLSNGIKHSDIANEYNISKSAITAINTRRTYKNIA